MFIITASWCLGGSRQTGSVLFWLKLRYQTDFTSTGSRGEFENSLNPPNIAQNLVSNVQIVSYLKLLDLQNKTHLFIWFSLQPS